jgi:hypothetical protein
VPERIAESESKSWTVCESKVCVFGCECVYVGKRERVCVCLGVGIEEIVSEKKRVRI